MAHPTKSPVRKTLKFAKIKIATRHINYSRAFSKEPISVLASEAFRKAEQSAFKHSGFIVVAEGGWVVRKFPGGLVEKIKQIPSVKKQTKIVLKS
jgi:hypothetical protein